MTRLSVMASSAIGLVSGTLAAAIPMAFRTPFNPLATGVAVAFGVGMTTYGLWHKYGQNCLARRIAKLIDAALIDQKEAIQQLVSKSVKEKLPQILNFSAIDDGIGLIVNNILENYATDPKIVSKTLEDLDQRIHYEEIFLIKGLVNQVSDSILDANCSGYYTPLRPYVKKPLNRIVATIAINFLKETTKTAIAKVEKCTIENTVNVVKNLANTGLNNIMDWGARIL